MSGPLNSTTTARGRVYRWRDETFDSVTTIIDRGVPKPELIGWAARRAANHAVGNLAALQEMVANGDTAAAVTQIAEAHVVERDTAAGKGTDVHAHVEATVLGEPIAAPSPTVAKNMEQFQRFVDDHSPEFLMSEATVYSRQHHYAGTLDLIGLFPTLAALFPEVTGRPPRLLADVKTGKGVYGSVALQLAAYRHAEYVGLPDGTEVPLPEVDGCVVLHLRPRSYKLIPVVADASIFRSFLYAQQVAHFVTDTAYTVLGEPIGPNADATRMRLAGVSFVDDYPQNLLALVDRCREDPIPLEVVRDRKNKFDANAISIRLNGVHLGWVPKDNAATLAPLIDSGAVFTAEAMFVAVSDANPDRPGLEIEIGRT